MHIEYRGYRSKSDVFLNHSFLSLDTESLTEPINDPPVGWAENSRNLSLPSTKIIDVQKNRSWLFFSSVVAELLNPGSQACVMGILPPAPFSPTIFFKI